jgi:two-component system response regulator
MTRSARVLLVDDSPTDVQLVRFAARQCRWIGELRDLSNGIAALEFLRSPPEHPPWRPDLILMDLNMPLMDGHELLAELKSDIDLRLIPAIMFTTSSASSDVKKAYSLHANSFVTKPPDFHALVECLQMVEQFWFQLAASPFD